MKDYLVESDLFEVTLPADNIYGEPAGRLLKPVAEKGIWLALTPFNPGKHTIRWKGTVGDYVQDITYNITQKYTP
ncbi:MAG TPA: hypothetical protein VFX59_24455 [Polyangiales bacterium]|nr:hypothetical protein [Polyangiales bacterium]